jgi:hypothetical protein
MPWPVRLRAGVGCGISAYCLLRVFRIHLGGLTDTDAEMAFRLPGMLYDLRGCARRLVLPRALARELQAG